MTDSTEQKDRLVQDLFDEAQRDYVGLWEIVGRLSRVHPSASTEVLLNETLEIARRLLDRGMVAGHLAENGGFEAWIGLSPDAVVRRIKAEWEVLGRPPSISDICWFNRTDASDQDQQRARTT